VDSGGNVKIPEKEVNHAVMCCSQRGLTLILLCSPPHHYFEPAKKNGCIISFSGFAIGNFRELSEKRLTAAQGQLPVFVFYFSPELPQ
jgi:hypothetical protein